MKPDMCAFIQATRDTENPNFVRVIATDYWQGLSAPQMQSGPANSLPNTAMSRVLASVRCGSRAQCSCNEPHAQYRCLRNVKRLRRGTPLWALSPWLSNVKGTV